MLKHFSPFIGFSLSLSLSLSLRYSVWTPLGDDKRLVWRLPRIQMMFQVYGSKEQALVTVEAVKTRGSTRFNLLALDVLNR